MCSVLDSRGTQVFSIAFSLSILFSRFSSSFTLIFIYPFAFTFFSHPSHNPFVSFLSLFISFFSDPLWTISLLRTKQNSSSERNSTHTHLISFNSSLILSFHFVLLTFLFFYFLSLSLFLISLFAAPICTNTLQTK